MEKITSGEGKGNKLIPLYEYLKDHPDFQPRWKLRHDPDGNFKACYNPEFGRIYLAVVIEEGADKVLAYDQPIIEEAKSGFVICPYYEKGSDIFLGLAEISRPVSDLEKSLEFPRCFGEPRKDVVGTVAKALKNEAGEIEIIGCAEGGRVNINTTFFKTLTRVIFAEVKPGGKAKDNFCFYKYPEDVENIQASGGIKCALTLAALSLFNSFRRGGKF